MATKAPMELYKTRTAIKIMPARPVEEVATANFVTISQNINVRKGIARSMVLEVRGGDGLIELNKRLRGGLEPTPDITSAKVFAETE